MAAMEKIAAEGTRAATSEKGSTTAATQSSNLERGTITMLPGNGDLLEYLLNHLGNCESLDLEFRAQD